MKAVEFTASHQGCWRKIAITLIDPRGQILNECKRLFTSNEMMAWRPNERQL
jgi:hypothetical protein